MSKIINSKQSGPILPLGIYFVHCKPDPRLYIQVSLKVLCVTSEHGCDKLHGYTTYLELDKFNFCLTRKLKKQGGKKMSEKCYFYKKKFHSTFDQGKLFQLNFIICNKSYLLSLVYLQY